jgi:hypothetical protein
VLAIHQEDNQRKVLVVSTRLEVVGVCSPSTAMPILERSSSPAAAAAAVVALIALASVAGVAGEVFFEEKFDGKYPDLTRLFVVSGSPVLLRHCAWIAVRCGCYCFFFVACLHSDLVALGVRRR